VDRYDPGYQGEEVIYPLYAPADYLTPEELKHIRALYAGEVTMVDRWVGMLLQKIEDLALFDNTVIIFTTDHGFYHGEHGLMGKSLITEEFKGYAPLYEEVAHIPLFIHLPERKSFRCGKLVQPPDLMPTILELAGAENPDTMHGKSLVPLLKGEKLQIRDFAVTSPTIIHGTAGALRTTITTEEWSFIYAGSGKARDEGETRDVDGIAMGLKALGQSFGHELYHLPSDPGQKRNLFLQRKEVAEDLQMSYIEFLKSLRTKEEYLEYWRAL
jgi:arylsulfatase A-like enzyme